MKKLLLTLGAAAIATGAYAADWQITQGPLTIEEVEALSGEHKIVVRTHARAAFGWWKPITTNAETGEGYFAHRCTDYGADQTIFPEDYVYTVSVSDGNILLKNAFDRYLPKANTKSNNTVFSSNIIDVNEAETLTIIKNPAIQASSTCAGMYIFRANTTCSGVSHSDLHLEISGDYCIPKYFATANGGLQQPSDNNSKTVGACSFYLVEKMPPIEVTFNFPAFGDLLPAPATASIFPGDNVTVDDILAPEYFTITGISETNTTVSSTNKTFNVTGTWDFPFTLNKVFRADLRRSASNSCTKWSVKANGQISTGNNSNADHFAPENLFYLKGHGYNSDNRLIVTLHSIAYADNYGFNCAQTNNAKGSITTEPTQWIVKTNSNSNATDKGISLQHSNAANAHANDISNILGVWNNANAQNDGGSFIRFFDLTEADFESVAWTAEDGLSYFLDETKMPAAKENPTPENVRAVFVKDRIATQATLTVNTVYNGRTLATYTTTDCVGTHVTVNPPAFFSDEAYTTTIPDTDTTVDYVLTNLNLPFAHTETTDNMRWQAVQIHTSYANTSFQGKTRYTWTYSEADSNTIIESEPTDKATNGFADTQLWAFVGNIVDGFKIYNKEAGNDMWLYSDGTNAKVGTTTQNSIWKPYVSASNSQSETYCCFKAEGTTYINMNVTHQSATQLTHWSGADNGSTCWFTAVSEPMLPTANGLELPLQESRTAPANAVGAILVNEGIDLSNAREIINAATADKYNYEAAEALRDLIALYNGNVTVNALQPNGYYRIANIHWTDNYMYTGHDDNKFYGSHYTGESYRANHASIFQFEPVPNQANRYYLKSQDVYVGHVTGTANASGGVGSHSGPVHATEVADRGEYSLVKESHTIAPGDTIRTAVYAIKDLSQTDVNSIHQGSDAGNGRTEISAWREWAGGSHFYVLLAEDIEVALDYHHEDLYVGFGYFPFPVSTTDVDTKFHYVHESTDRETGEPVITYSEIAATSIAANTPIMISHKSSGSAILAIGANTPANAPRRAIAADGSNTIVEGTQETDTWSGTSWTKATADEVPEAIATLGGDVAVANIKYMSRSVTFKNGGDLSVDFMYTSGSERVDICGIALLDTEGTVVASDYHIGYSGTNKVNKVYSVKVPAAGTYTLRYYISNADTRMNTNGNIFIDFTGKEETALLAGHLRSKNVEAGDYVIGVTSRGLGFTKVTDPTAVKNNYVSLPAANFYDSKLAAATEIPLVNSNTTTTGISEIIVKEPAAGKVIYDLQGRRLNAPVKGVNIINGKKVLVK